MHNVEYKLLRTTEELYAFAPRWRALWWQDPQATPFQSPEWLLPWWRQFGQPDLRAVTISKSGEPMGFLPFYIYREPHTGARQLLLLGVGTTDYLGGIFSSACMQEHVQAALNLLRADEDWDVMYASQLLPHSKLFQAFQQSLDSNAHPFDAEACSRMRAVPISDLPQKIRRNAMYYRNRAMRAGRLEFAIANGSNWEESFDALQHLHRERWDDRGQTGVLSDGRVLRWHREALPKLECRGMLRLCSLRLNNEVIGVLYSLIDPPSRPTRTQYVYLTAYSIRHAELRPGTVLLAMAIENAAKEGVQVIDMLRGEEAYKRNWHMERIPTYGFAMPYAHIACAGTAA